MLTSGSQERAHGAYRPRGRAGKAAARGRGGETVGERGTGGRPSRPPAPPGPRPLPLPRRTAPDRRRVPVAALLAAPPPSATSTAERRAYSWVLLTVTVTSGRRSATASPRAARSAREVGLAGLGHLEGDDLRAALAGQLVRVRVGHVLAVLDGERVARGERPLVARGGVGVEREDHGVADLDVDLVPTGVGQSSTVAGARRRTRPRTQREASRPARPAPAPPRRPPDLPPACPHHVLRLSAGPTSSLPLPPFETRDVCQAFRARLSSPQGNSSPFVDPPPPTAYGHCTLPLRRDRRRRRPRRDLRRPRTRAPQRRLRARRRARTGHRPARLPRAQERGVRRLRALRHHLRLGRRRRLQRRQAHADARRRRLARPVRRHGRASPSSSGTSTASGASTARPRRSTAAARSSRSSARRRSSTA